MHAEAISGLAHQLTFRADAFKEHDQLQLEEDDRINGRPPCAGVRLLDQVSHAPCDPASDLDADKNDRAGLTPPVTP